MDRITPKPLLRLLFVAGCCSGAPVAVLGAEPPTVRLIAASSTDSAIDDVIGVHHVAIGAADARIGKLLLFLPGTTASAQMYSTLIERAASVGYHAIGLAYENEIAVNAICAGLGASGCHEQVRREVLFGTDESPWVEVDADNGVFNRLDRLLAHLEIVAPGEAWNLYRDAGGPVRWNRVVVSGHSQGAGHAAFVAHVHRVARAVLFSGTEPAPWTRAGDFATPGEDFHGFVHFLEPIYTPIQASWENIGIPGVPTSVDGALPPYGGSQQLGTSNEDCSGDPPIQRLPPQLPLRRRLDASGTPRRYAGVPGRLGSPVRPRRAASGPLAGRLEPRWTGGDTARDGRDRPEVTRPRVVPALSAEPAACSPWPGAEYSLPAA